MKKANKITLNGTCNWRAIGTLVVITLCLTGVMSPAMTQSSLSLFNNASDGTDGEIPETTPATTPTPVPTPTPLPLPSPTPTPTPCPTPTPTPGPTPTLTPTPSPSPAAPIITSFAPSSPVHDTEGATRTFNITIDQVVNVSWLLNGTVVNATEKSVTEASYTNTSPAVGTWNISAIATNENGTVSRTWIWNVSPQETPTPSPSPLTTPTPSPTPTPTPTPIQSLASNGTTTPSSTPLFIFGYVFYENGASCDNHPTVNITNQNTSKRWQADTVPGYNFYQLTLAAGRDINAGDILQFNITDGVNSNTTNYPPVVQSEINKGVLFDFNLSLPFTALPVYVELTPDDNLTVPEVQVINPQPDVNKTVTITANVTNVNGRNDTANVTATIYGPSNIAPVSLIFISDRSTTTATYNATFNMSYHLEGDYNVVVNATSTGGLTGTCTQSFNYSCQKRLIPILKMELTPDDDTEVPGLQVINPFPDTNKTVTVTADVTNMNGWNDTVNVTANITGLSIVKDSPVNLSFVSNSSAITATYSGTFNMSNHSEGNYTVEVATTNVWNETSNSTKQFSYLYGSDLVVTDISVPEYVVANRSNEINATIVNNGTARATEFKVSLSASLSANETVVDSMPVSALYPGANATVNFCWMPTQEGNYTLTVTADSGHDVNESNETNNNLTKKTVFVGAPDFSVTSPSLNNRTQPLDGDTVYVTATIFNNGSREGNCIFELCDEKITSIERMYAKDDSRNFSRGGTDVFVQPGAIEMRIHFVYLYVKEAGSYINVYNKTGIIEEFPAGNKSYYIDRWVNCSGDEVTIKSDTGNDPNACAIFAIDKYEAVLNIRTFLLHTTENESLSANWTATTGNHTLLARAIPLVPEYNATNNQEGTAVYVQATRDFKVANISVLPPSPFIFDNVTINASIENAGNRSGWVTVAFYPDDDIEAFNETTVFVNANETANGTSYAEIVWANAEPHGNHNITVIADPQNVIGEINETNNENVTQIFVNAFDFSVDKLNLSTTTPVYGCNVTINATIKNLVDRRSENVKVRFFADDAPFANSSVHVNASSENYTEAVWVADEVGEHNITVEVDPDDEITELDEFNNSMSKEIVVSGTDLEVLSIVVARGAVYYNTAEVNIMTVISNSGALNASSFNVSFYNDSSLIRTTRNLSLDAGDTMQLNTSWDASFGNHTISVEIETDCSKENNVTNTNMSISIDIRPADFTVSNITVSPKEIREGENVSISATISENRGNRSGFVNVSFFVDSEFGTPIATNVTFVEANGTAAVTATWNGFPDINHLTTEHYITAVVDPDEKILELNESNNELTSEPITMTLSNITITNLSIEPSEPVIGSNVSVIASLKNNEAETANTTVWFYEEFEIKLRESGYTWSKNLEIPQGASRMMLNFSKIHAAHTGVAKVTVIDEDDNTIFYWEGNEILGVETEWGTGNLTVEMEKVWPDDCGLTFGYEIDKKYAIFKTEPVSSVNAGESRDVIWNWKNNVSAAGDTNPVWAQTSVDRQSEKVYVNGTDLAVTTIMHNRVYDEKDRVYKVRKGEPVSINATISNFGLTDASNFTVRFKDTFEGSEPETFNGTDISGLKANHSMWVNRTWNATRPGGHTLRVEIDPCGNPENDDTNNAKSIDNVQVFIPWGFAVTAINFSPLNPKEGENVTINATIANVGAINYTVNVSFFADAELDEREKKVVSGRLIGNNVSVNVNMNDTNCTPNVIWTAKLDFDHLTAVRNITAWVDPENKYDHEKKGERDNIRTEQIHITEDLLIVNITAEPADPAYDDVVNVTAVIENRGTESANITAWFFAEKEIDKNIDVKGRTSEDKITQHGGSRMRVYLTVSGGPRFQWLKIYNETETTPIKEIGAAQKSWSGWTDWVHGNTIMIKLYDKASYQTGSTFSIDKCEVYIGNNTKTIPAGGNETFSVNWSEVPVIINDDEYLMGNYTINVWTVDGERGEDVFVQGFDLAVTDIAVEEEVRDGDAVNVTATIHNFGAHPVKGNFTVQFWEVFEPTTECPPDEINPTRYNCTAFTNYTLIREITITTGLAANASMHIPLPCDSWKWDARVRNISCNGMLIPIDPEEGLDPYTVPPWNEIGYNYSIFVNVTPAIKSLENDYDHVNEMLGANNENETELVRVKKSRDFSIANVTLTVNNETRDPMQLVCDMNVTVNVTVNVTNLANRGGNVPVGFYLDDSTLPGSPGNATYKKGNGTGYAVLEWHVVTPGAHDLTVFADPANDTIEFNESNNDNAIIPVFMYAKAANLTVTNISFEIEEPVRGDKVNITATVANLGEVNVDNVTVRFTGDRKERIKLPDDYALNTNYSYNISAPGFEMIRLHFNRIVLPKDTHIYVYDANGTEIEHYEGECSRKPQLTNWIEGAKATVKLVIGPDPEGPYYKLEFGLDYIIVGIEEAISLDAAGEENKNIPVVWNDTQAGVHVITVKIDPEDNIIEYTESNNELSKTMRVQGPDLTVSDMKLLRCVNGTEIGENETITHGEWVKIVANISNIGILPAEKNFNVSYYKNNTPFRPDPPTMTLAPNESKTVSAYWCAQVGDNELKVIADCDDDIIESNETNNEKRRTVDVRAADLFVSNVTFTVLPPEENATMDLTNATNETTYYDTDVVKINATIVNDGVLPANGFDVSLFYEYAGLGSVNKSYDRGTTELPDDWQWTNISYEGEGAECILVYSDMEKANDLTNLQIYDKNDIEVPVPSEDNWYSISGDSEVYWYPIMGDTVKIHYNNVHGVGFDLDHYAGNITTKQLSVGVNDAENVSMEQRARVGEYVVKVFVDHGNEVIEHNETNNTASVPMRVLPSRDFTVVNLTTEPDARLLDDDAVTVNATIAMSTNESDPYHEYKKGTTDIDLIDEHAWVELTQPRYELTPFGYCYNISYPGADAIRVHFSQLHIGAFGSVALKDKKGETQCTATHAGKAPCWVTGDTAYVCKAWQEYTENISFNIDKYQYRIINRSTNRTFTENEHKEAAATWNVSAWEHTIRVIADPDNTTWEISEGNNEQNETRWVDACKDPAVTNITFNPKRPDPEKGESVLITAEVENRGTRAATFTVDLWAEKTESVNYESKHPIPLVVQYVEQILTYPEADWIGVHFTKIQSFGSCDSYPGVRQMYVADRNDNKIDYYSFTEFRDRWAWARGNVTRVIYTNVGDGVCAWGFSVDKVVHKRILNHTTLTLGAGNSTNVSGLLRNLQIGDGSLYQIHAVVDMDNIVYETDETNNEMEKELELALPDLTVSDITCDGEAKAIIENLKDLGRKEAENVTVRFFRDVKLRYPMKEWNYEPIWEKGADVMRVHFEYLWADEDENEYLRVGNGTPGCWKKYDRDKDGFWCPPRGEPPLGGEWIMLSGNASYKIDKYEYGVDEKVTPKEFGAGMKREMELPEVEGEHKFKAEKEVYNLTVWVDPEDEILERIEWNNMMEMMMGPDIDAENINVEPYAPIMLDTCYITGIKNIGCVRTGEFNLMIHINTTEESEAKYPTCTYDNVTFTTINLAPKQSYSFPWETPECIVDSQPVDLDYNIKVAADEGNEVVELNDRNNNGSDSVTVYSHTDYKGRELEPYTSGSVYGGIIYTVGDSAYEGVQANSIYLNRNVNFDVDMPGDAGVELARLYLYWTWSYDGPVYTCRNPVPINVTVAFNGNSPTSEKKYIEYPHATSADVGWGTYAYKLPATAVGTHNWVRVEKISPFNTSNYRFAISGMGLLVVYNSRDDGVLTNYWINEGADVLYDEANNLSETDLITTAKFGGSVENIDLTNTTLLTVVAGGNDKAALEFNHGRWGGIVDGDVWSYPSGLSNDSIGINYSDVTEYLANDDNEARLQYIHGNSMMSSNAVLIVGYPPDLEPSLEKAPPEVVIGNSYDIPVVINNVGKSKAKDFNVSFYVDDELIEKKPVDLVEGDGGSTTKKFHWTAPSTIGIVEFKVVVDPDNDIEELINDIKGKRWDKNGESNESNVVTKPIPVDSGDWEWSPGGGGGTGEGWGEGTGPGEGGIGGEAAADGSGEGAVGKFEGKDITGYLMKGIAPQSGAERGGGGGERGEFSLVGLLLRIAMLAVAAVLVYAGYLLERRRQNNINNEK